MGELEEEEGEFRIHEILFLIQWVCILALLLVTTPFLFHQQEYVVLEQIRFYFFKRPRKENGKCYAFISLKNWIKFLRETFDFSFEMIIWWFRPSFVSIGISVRFIVYMDWSHNASMKIDLLRAIFITYFKTKL